MIFSVDHQMAVRETEAIILRMKWSVHSTISQDALRLNKNTPHCAKRTKIPYIPDDNLPGDKHTIAPMFAKNPWQM